MRTVRAGWLCCLSWLFLAVPLAANAATDPPHGDLTGDGNVDAFSLVSSDSTFPCSLIIATADAGRPFTGGTLTLPIQPLIDLAICPLLTAVGRVRGARNPQVFVADDHDTDGHSLVTAVRGADDFGLESPAFDVRVPGRGGIRDTDHDGRGHQSSDRPVEQPVLRGRCGR